jgi:thermolabile hemolysin
VWARTPGASLMSIYKLGGNWWKDGSPRNMFFTNTSQATLKSVCQSTFAQMGVSQPLMMFAAADNPLSVNYTVWSNDSFIQPSKISKVIVFGDSMSDNQNVYNATHWEAPSPHNYFLGRFSNGKVWNEYMADALSLANYNWAVGGAAADDVYILPGIGSQVASYVEYMKSAPNYRPANSLFTVMIGANDLISYGRTPTEIIASEETALQSLIAAGARNILLGTLPDLSRAPKFSEAMNIKTPAERQKVKEQVLELNGLLVAMRDRLQTANPTLRIRVFDSYAEVEKMVNNSLFYGFTDVGQSCLQLTEDSPLNYVQTRPVRPACTNADAYIFWDLLHPTTRTHKLISDAVVPFVKANFPVQ